MNSMKNVYIYIYIHWLKDDRRRELTLWSVHRRIAKYLGIEILRWLYISSGDDLHFSAIL